MRDGASGDMRSILRKVVGKKFEQHGICIEQYYGDNGHMKYLITCDSVLADKACEDGLVFIAHDRQNAQIISHGLWEEYLKHFS